MNNVKIRSKFRISSIIPQEMNIFDIIVIVVIYIGCWVLFCYPDIFVTASYSHAYLDGHILDFNRFNRELFPNGYIDYLYPIYIVFAIWQLPLKIFGLLTPVANKGLEQMVLGGVKLYPFETIWLKLLLILSIAVCSIVIYKISKLLCGNKNESKLTAWMFLCNPVTIYSSLIFTGYDILGLTLTMIGLYYFLKHNHKLFVLFFTLAIPFKFFALVPFIALLLLVRKNIWKILLNLLSAGSFTAAIFLYATLIDKGSTGLRLVAAKTIGECISFGELMTPSLELLSLVVVYFICYITQIDNDEDKHKRSAVWLPLASLLSMFTFIHWHPMWLIILIPWFLFAFQFIENKVYPIVFMIVGVLAMFVKFFDQFSWCDNHLFSDGALRAFFPIENISVGALIPGRIIPFFDALLLIFFLSPFILRWIEKKGIILPAIGLFKTQTGYVRLLNYGCMAFYIALVFAMLALTIKFPQFAGAVNGGSIAELVKTMLIHGG